jgi:uncharacterized protein YbjT (DUF2867 family)
VSVPHVFQKERIMFGPIVLIGGRGKTGGLVADRLVAKGLPVRLASRSTGFDWTLPETWASALEGARAVYITYYPDLMVRGSAEAVEQLAALALSLGVKRLVLLSGRGEDECLRAEEKLRGSGTDWTIVRASWFNQNFDQGNFLPMIQAGELALPVPEIGEPFIDTRDIADVAVAALTDDKHIGKLYEVTGPRLLSFSDAVAEIGAAAGRDVRFTRLTPQEFLDELEREGVPKFVADILEELFGVVLDGRNAYVTDGVQQALGRPPRDFSDFAREAAATGIWGAQS